MANSDGISLFKVLSTEKGLHTDILPKTEDALQKIVKYDSNH
jgi:hypothetical protein